MYNCPISGAIRSKETGSMAMGQDHSLGLEVHKHLLKLGIETPALFPSEVKISQQRIAEHFQAIMKELNLDMSDDSLSRTPERVAKMYAEEIFWGLDYRNFPRCSSINNKMRYDEVVSCKCTVKSSCEHHAVPFIGIAHVAYIPHTKVLGLSKFNRVVDFFSRRPQIQERLTAQIQKTLEFVLDTSDVAVVVKAQHYCVHLRGVEDTNSETTTSAMGGRFLSVPALRQEFLALTR
jgi:GTP cyclohydrolase I